MTTELELEFFKVFGIKPIFRYFVQSELPVIGTDHCRPTYDLTKEQFKNFALSRAKGYKLVEVVKIYPEITDRKLLEMICIFSQHCNFGRWNKYAMHSIDDFEYIMLSQLIEYQKKRYTYGIKEKIQQLFKEGE